MFLGKTGPLGPLDFSDVPESEIAWTPRLAIPGLQGSTYGYGNGFSVRDGPKIPSQAAVRSDAWHAFWPTSTPQRHHPY